MQFNQEAFDDFWWFINERHRIYLKKIIGRPKPWTEDPILRDWKFCNVFRQYDKQSKLLIDNVIKPHWNDDLSLMLFNIYAFRAFNWFPTYANLAGMMGQNGWLDRWVPYEAKQLLYDQTCNGDKLTSGAYMIRGREGMPKYESIVQTLTDIWDMKESIADCWDDGEVHSLEHAQWLLMDQGFWGWGSFTTYQVVLDLTYTKWLENAVDINTWCEFGPGAIRGIHYIWPEAKRSEFLDLAKWLLSESHKYLQSHVPELSLQDIEFCLCETTSYERVKLGGKKKQHYEGI